MVIICTLYKLDLFKFLISDHVYCTMHVINGSEFYKKGVNNKPICSNNNIANISDNLNT
jgi:hypothetical protein